MLRTKPLFTLLAAVSLSACTFLEEPLGDSHSGGAPAPLPAVGPIPRSQPTNVCAASLGTCADYATLPKPARPRPGAAVAYTSADGQTDLALYADGTLLRTVTAKSRGYADWYWDLGDVRAKVSAATTKDLLARLEQIQAMKLARPFFGAGHATPTSADLFTFDDGEAACASHPIALADGYFCQEPEELALLRRELDVLGAAAHEKWLSATEGTLALMAETHPLPWPLDLALATAGDHVISASEHARLEGCSTWTLPDGRYLLAGRWSMTYGGGRVDYRVRVSDVEVPAVLPDAPTSLRAELLATAGKLGWSAEWLGIEADRTVFPAFKGKRLVIFPKTETEPMRVYGLVAFEHRDLTADGEL
jgi:hypothetical protein